MKRYIANYTIVPHRGIFVNHVVTIGSDGRLISVTPFEDELAYTVYVPGTIAVIPQHIHQALPQLIKGLHSRNHIYQALTQATQPQELNNSPVNAVSILKVR